MKDDVNNLSHSKWNCKYHIVFAPKYRRKAIYGQLRKDIGKILRQLCEFKEVKIIKGEMCPDHVHMLVEIPPKMSVASFMGYIKGRSAIMIFDRYPEYRSKWDQKFWATEYYVKTVGEITEEAIKKYIEEQEDADKQADLIR